jgi:hypothetical protein
MPVVALVTYAASPGLTTDDALLARALDDIGIRSEPAPWDDARVRWDAFDAVVVRSCWDYHLRAAEFLAWVARLDDAGVALHNAPAVLRWNADKRYLRDVAAASVPIVPTHWVDAGASIALGDILDDTGWDRVVVKPVVSAQAHDTWRASRDSLDVHGPRFAELSARASVMVQPFVDAVTMAGEWSLLFFDHVFSHAVLKRPASGDFRVQREHGGSHAAIAPPPSIVDDAARALACAPERCLYARVDGCVVDGRLHVMELELLEPSLYLADDARAPARLAAAIAARLG